MYNNKKHSISVDGDLEMKKHLNIDNARIQKMLEIKLKVFNKIITPTEARKLVNESFESVSAEEFAYGEQHLFNAGITDEVMAEGMDDILDVFKDVLVAGSTHQICNNLTRYSLSHAALSLLVTKLPFPLSFFKRFNVIFLIIAKFSAERLFLFLCSSSRKTISNVQCKEFSTLQ